MGANSRLVSVRVPEEMWARLEVARREMGERSISDVIRIAVDLHLGMLGFQAATRTTHPVREEC